MTVLLDLPALVLPLLLRDPAPLARLLDVLPEVSDDAQEQVIAAAWYLTGAGGTREHLTGCSILGAGNCWADALDSQDT